MNVFVPGATPYNFHYHQGRALESRSQYRRNSLALKQSGRQSNKAMPLSALSTAMCTTSLTHSGHQVKAQDGQWFCNRGFGGRFV